MHDHKHKAEMPAGAGSSLPSVSLFQISTLVYAVMTCVGLIICAYAHQDFLALFHVPRDPKELLKLAAITGLGTGILMVLSYLFEEMFAGYRQLKIFLIQVLGPSSLFMAAYLALLSSIGEEILFRGAIQPYAGLVVTSLLFGLLHLGPDGQISAWSVWAVLAGLLLGWIFQETKLLWPCIVIHFAVNFISILSLRRQFRARMKQMLHQDQECV